MNASIKKRNWWIVPVVGGVLAIVVAAIQQVWLPDYGFAAFLIALVILGIAFSYVYVIDRKGLWWAQIPALAMVVLLITGIVAYFSPKDASGSSPYGVVTLGLGAAVMGLVLSHPRTKFVMYIIALIALLVGFLMLPLTSTWKIILIAVDVLLVGYLAWQTVRQPAMK
jgi:hypothetical protein